MQYDEKSGDEAYAELFIGRKVVEARDSHLLLDDGTALKVVPNDGGCSCGAGDYRISEMNTCDNIITGASLQESSADGEDGHVYRLFVYAANDRINVLSVEGDDGNGYYGTGFTITVVPASQMPRKRGLNDHLLY
jgi:hypothetical protein